MKTFVISAFALVACVSADASERLKVTESNDQRPAAVALMERIAEACSSGDFRAYASCFTSRKFSFLKSKVRPVFVSKDLDMRLLNVTIDYVDEEKMEFEVHYLWSEGFGQTKIIADIIARKENDEWKVDSEKIVGSKPHAKVESDEVAFALPRAQNIPFAFGGEEVRFLQPGDPGWDPDSPKDMPQIPGSCRGGRCGIRQPEAPIVQLKPGDPEWDPDAPADFIQVPNSCRDGSCKVK